MRAGRAHAHGHVGSRRRYGETLETLLIGSAAPNWLEWYWIENDMGKKGMQVVTETGERPIVGLETLADLLMECRP